MIKRSLWVIGVYVFGWLTLVPVCAWMLFTRATRENLAMLIVLPLAWIFGYFPIAGSLLSAWQIRKFMKALDRIKTSDQLKSEFLAHGMDDVVVDLIAQENGIPEWLVRRAVKAPQVQALIKRAIEREREASASPQAGD